MHNRHDGMGKKGRGRALSRIPTLIVVLGWKLSGNVWPSWNLSTYFVCDIVIALPETGAKACGVSMSAE